MPSPRKWRTSLRGRSLLTTGAVAVALLVPAVLAPSQADSSLPKPKNLVVAPAERPLPATLDLPQQYQRQSICAPPAKPGTAALATLLTTTYGPHTMYTARACADDPTSEHTEGRALDWMVSGKVPEEKAQAEAFLNWLLAPGADGTPAVMARRMGIMYIGWNNQIWRGYNPIGWGELKGCQAKAKAGKAYDTYCHRDHIHFSLTWEGAAARTSYWDGSAQLTPPCPVKTVRGSKTKLPAARSLSTLAAPKTLVNTSTGAGNKKRVCRIQQTRWSSDTQRLDAKVVGKAGVPADAVRVLVEVTAIDPNAPMDVRLWGTGRKVPKAPTLTTAQNVTSGATKWVRPGRGGYVSVATATGETHVRLRALAYEVPS